LSLKLKISTIFSSVFLKDALSLSGGTAIAQVITFVSLPILTRLYTPEDFGILALYVAISSMLSIFATLKIEQIIMLPESDEDAENALLALFVISLLFSLLILILIFIFNEYYSIKLDERPELGKWLWFIPVSVFLFSIYQGLRFWLMRNKLFKLISISLISAIVTGSLVSIVIGYSYKHLLIGPAGLLIGHISEGLARPIIMLFGLHGSSLFRTEKSFNKIYASVLTYKKMILTLLVSHGISAIYSRALIMAIDLFYGPAILGYFSMAQKIISAPPALISNALGDVFRQRASVAWREQANFSLLFRKTLLLCSLIGVPLYSLAIVIAPDVFDFVLGDQWRIAGQYASIIMVSGLFAFIVTPIDKGAIIVGAYRYIFNWHLARLFLYVFSIGLVYFYNYDVIYLLCLIVLIDVCLSIIDCFYEYSFSKGISEKH
jgi:O-antigen/teichoic acid export membrane protein